MEYSSENIYNLNLFIKKIIRNRNNYDLNSSKNSKLFNDIICDLEPNIANNKTDVIYLETLGLTHKLCVLKSLKGFSHFHLIRSIELLSLLTSKDNYFIKLELAELYLWIENYKKTKNLISNFPNDLDYELLSKRKKILSRYYFRILEFNKALENADEPRLITCINIQKGYINKAINQSLDFYRFSKRNDYSDIPYWNGENKIYFSPTLITMHDKNGGGDELLFAKAITFFRFLGKNLFIEAEPRSYELYLNSFPNHTVFIAGGELPWETNKKLKKPIIQVDTRYFFFYKYKSKYFFPKSYKYFKTPYRSKRRFVNSIMDHSKGKLKVGINWRSYLNVGETSLYNCSLIDFKLMFKQLKSKVSFYNLQYDITEQEKEYISEKLDLDIYYPEIDQMNDFNALAAYISELDLCLMTNTTNLSIAGGVGKKILNLVSNNVEEHSLSAFHWYPKQYRFKKGMINNWEKPIKEVTIEIEKELRSIKNINRKLIYFAYVCKIKIKKILKELIYVSFSFFN